MPTNKQIGEKIFDKCTEIYEILNNDKEAEAKEKLFIYLMKFKIRLYIRLY